MSEKDYGSVQIAVAINSSFETQGLYKEITERGWEYIQDMGGPLVTLGKLEGRPVCVAPVIHTINGVKVLYVEATSGVVDWTLIETWVKGNTPPDTKFIQDPINLLYEVRDLAEKDAEVEFTIESTFARISEFHDILMRYKGKLKAPKTKGHLLVRSTVNGVSVSIGMRNVSVYFDKDDNITMVFRTSPADGGIRHTVTNDKLEDDCMNLVFNWLLRNKYDNVEFVA